MRASKPAWPGKVWRMYRDGFREMTLGKRLWVIIIVKLVVIFAVFRLFFFPDLLKEKYDTDDARARAVAGELVRRSPS